jgi:pimeloyl-ACP methyl ester carboxylesterase
MATFVLIHGGWSGGWQWCEVATLLRAQGHDVFTPSLTGVGERVHLASPNITLETHVQDIVNVFRYENLSDVVFVGHSSGGLAITAAAEHLADKISRLIYVDAYVPEDGKAVLDLFDPNVKAWLLGVAQAHGDGWRIPHNPPDADRRTDALVKPLLEPIHLLNPIAARLPRTFIYCTDKSDLGPIGAPITEAAQKAKLAGWRYHELATTHCPNWTMPNELAALLLER